MDDFRYVGDERIINPAIWQAKTLAEVDLENEVPKITIYVSDEETNNPDDDPDFHDVNFTDPGGGSSDAPVIYSMSPSSGPPGTVVKLTGVRFLGHGHILPANTLEFNNSVPGRPASFAILSDTEIKCIVPEGAIDGRIALHSWDPVVEADVITLTDDSFHPTAGSVPPPSIAPADPSVTVKWSAFDVDGSNSLHGQFTVEASQPMIDVTIDHILGQAASDAFTPAGFFASGTVYQSNPGASKEVAIQTPLLTGVGQAGIDLEGAAFVRATFKVGSKIRVVRKKVRVVRKKKKYRPPQATIVLDNDDLQVYIMPPILNPLAKYVKPEWNLKNEVSTTLTVLCKRGDIISGSLVFKMWSAFGMTQQNTFTPRNKGLCAAMVSKAQNYGPIEAWGAQVPSGSLVVRRPDGTTATHALGGDTSGSLLPCTSGGGIRKTVVNL